MPGVFVIDRHASPGRILSDLEIMASVSGMDEWRDLIVFVPL